MATIKKIKEYLSDKTQDQLINLILKYYNKNQENKDLLDIAVDPESEIEIYKKYKQQIKNNFFPERGEPHYNFTKIREIIKNYKNISTNEKLISDLILSAVENGVDFTDQYGDIDEKFYNSIINLYDMFLVYSTMNGIQNDFQDRCYEIMKKTSGIGWGFHDELAEMYATYFFDE